MALARFKDLVMDATEPRVLADFWGRVLGRDVEYLADGDAVLRGDRPMDTIWVNRVPDQPTGKNRVHMDLFVGSLDPLLDAGATVQRPEGDEIHWTVMTDPAGGVFCAFLRDEQAADAPAEPFELIVDTFDATSSKELSDWWADVLGGTSTDDGRGFWWVEDTPDLPFETFDAIPVGEDKQGKNRVHWDLFCDDVDELVSRGARIRRRPDVDVGWHVMQDPQGNEFCAFPSTPR